MIDLTPEQVADGTVSSVTDAAIALHRAADVDDIETLHLLMRKASDEIFSFFGIAYREEPKP